MCPLCLRSKQQDKLAGFAFRTLPELQGPVYDLPVPGGRIVETAGASPCLEATDADVVTGTGHIGGIELTNGAA